VLSPGGNLVSVWQRDSSWVEPMMGTGLGLRTGKLQFVDMILLYFTEFVEWKCNLEHVEGCKRQQWLQRRSRRRKRV